MLQCPEEMKTEALVPEQHQSLYLKVSTDNLKLLPFM